MTKYEYKVLTCQLSGMKWYWFDETNNIGEVSSSAVLTKLGAEGWGFPTMMHGIGGNTSGMILMRPVN